MPLFCVSPHGRRSSETFTYPSSIHSAGATISPATSMPFSVIPYESLESPDNVRHNTPLSPARIGGSNPQPSGRNVCNHHH